MARTIGGRSTTATRPRVAAEEAFDRVHKQRDLPEEIPELPVPASVIRVEDGRTSCDVPALLVALGLVASRSEGGRMLSPGRGPAGRRAGVTRSDPPRAQRPRRLRRLRPAGREAQVARVGPVTA